MKILIVEDHKMVSEGFRELLLNVDTVTQVDHAKNGLEAVSKTKEVLPDVVIMDYDLPVYDGIFGTKEILEVFPQMPILMVSVYKRKEIIIEAIRAGVKGFLPKEARAEEMIQAVKALHKGEYWFKGKIAEVAVELLAMQTRKEHRSKSTLTKRQTEVVRLLAEGLKHSDIAEELKISLRTVEVHKRDIFKRLNVSSNTELLRYAIKNKLVEI